MGFKLHFQAWQHVAMPTSTFHLMSTHAAHSQLPKSPAARATRTKERWMVERVLEAEEVHEDEEHHRKPAVLVPRLVHIDLNSQVNHASQLCSYSASST